MYRYSWGPRQATLDLLPLLPIRPLARPMVSRWLTEVPIKFHHGVVTFGVVGLSFPLVSVKLTDMRVPLTFLSKASRVLNLWLKYPYQG